MSREVTNTQNRANPARKAHPILDPAEEVADRAQSVKIVPGAVQQLALELSLNAASAHWLTAAPGSVRAYLDKLSLNQNILFLTVFHAAGFSYWGQPRWSVRDAGTVYNGAMAWLICLSKNPDCLEPEFLASLTVDKLQAITRGQSTAVIPMLAERLAILQRLGTKLHTVKAAEELISRFTAGGAALDLAFLIADQLPGFDDRAAYDDLNVPFLKRAQLLLSDINYLLEKGQHPTLEIDDLTVCADYKIPQFLRHKNVLSYEPKLAEKIDNQIELAGLSKEEIEIRACTIVAAEALRQELLKEGVGVNGAQLDGRLWLAAQQSNNLQPRPYHRCRTIYY